METDWRPDGGAVCKCYYGTLEQVNDIRSRLTVSLDVSTLHISDESWASLQFVNSLYLLVMKFHHQLVIILHQVLHIQRYLGLFFKISTTRAFEVAGIVDFLKIIPNQQRTPIHFLALLPILSISFALIALSWISPTTSKPYWLVTSKTDPIVSI